MNILITGTSRGLGLMLTEILLAEGHVVHGISRSEMMIDNPSYQHHSCDLENIDEVKKVADSIEAIDVLINSAAIARLNPFLLSDENDYHSILKTNLLAPYVLTREMAKKMVSNRFGRIINITTIGTKLNFKGEIPYITSKAALEKFTEILSKELFPFGITVNNLGISLLQTHLIKGLTEAQITAIKSQLTSPDYISAKDVKHVIDFLISPEARGITGQTINFGGV